ncbi:MAG: hypothetical protein ACE5I5_01520 [Candidatus Heimdallarchaeota archaeon]
MSHNKSERVILLLVCLMSTLFLVEGTLGIKGTKFLIRASGLQTPPVLQDGTLLHDYFPIMLRGSDVPQLEGLWDNNIRITFYKEGWHLESFQIDERDPNQSDLFKQGGFVATEPGHPHWTEDTSDQTNQLGKDDELVFYARQGDRVSEENWWNPTYSNRMEIEIQEPSEAGNGTAWMYIYYDTQDHGRWQEDPAYYDYITWSGKTNDWYTMETDWFLSSLQDRNPGLQDRLQLAPTGENKGMDLIEEGVKKYTEAFVDLPREIGEIQAYVREGHWNNTYYDDIVDNMGYGGSRTQQNSADGVACIDGPVRAIYFSRHYYSYTILGLPTFELEVENWSATYLMGSYNGPIPATNKIGPVNYIEEITTASFSDVEGMKFIDEIGRLGIIDGNPFNDDFTSLLSSPSHWSFYYGSHGSIWVAMPYDPFVIHGGEAKLYWADTGKWHHGEAGQFIKITPGNSTWWTTPIWSFVGGTILSDSFARTKAFEYNVLYENWLQTGNFFQISRDLTPIEPRSWVETFPPPGLPYSRTILKWAPLLVLVVLIGLVLLWKRIKTH